MKRGAVIGIVTAAAVLSAAAVGLWIAMRPTTAEDTANAYLRALAAGDFPGVEATLEQPVAARDEVSTAFDGADAYIDGDYSLEIAAVGDSRATAHATTTLDGTSATVAFALVNTDDGWRVGEDHLVAIEVTTTLGDSVRIGDALIAIDAAPALLTAVYPVAAAPEGLLSGDAHVRVADDAPPTVELAAELSPTAIGTVQEQVDAYARACAEPTSSVPENCGIRIPWAVDLTRLDSLAFRIEELPTVTLSDDARTFAAVDGVLVATATGAARDGGTASFTYRADDWALRGSVAFRGDEMVLTAR